MILGLLILGPPFIVRMNDKRSMGNLPLVYKSLDKLFLDSQMVYSFDKKNFSGNNLLLLRE
jgi:hypothetical protein